MNFKKLLRVSVLIALVGLVNACGSTEVQPITFEQGSKQLNCEGNIWNGEIYFTITTNTGPEIQMVDEASNDFTVSNYNFRFDLFDKQDNKVATSNHIDLIRGGDDALGVAFSPISGYEATKYIAYLNGKEIASEDVGVWVEFPGTPKNIVDGKCKTNFDIDWDEFRKDLPWCEVAFKDEYC